MVDDVYMSVGKPTPPQTQEEMLDNCWLNGNLALIRTFVEAAAERYKFADPKVYDAGSNTHHENHSLRVKFNTAVARNHDDLAYERRAISEFEQEMVNTFGDISKHLKKGQSPQEHRYTLPLHRMDVVRIGNEIKASLAPKLPPSVFISHLKKQ